MANSEELSDEFENRRKAFAEEMKDFKLRAIYEDQLARKQFTEQLQQQQRAYEQYLLQQEEALVKQLELKSAALEKDLESDIQKIEAEVRAKAAADRENQALILEQIRLKAAENRATVLNSLKTPESIFRYGFNAVFSDWGRVSYIGAGITILLSSYYAVKRGTGIAARYSEALFKTPGLIQETSRLSVDEIFKHPFKVTQRLFMLKPKVVLQDAIILNRSLEERLSRITIATRNTRKNKGKYRNLLLYGPPGTGKTLFVKRLAQHCGVNYAIMSGADVVTLGQKGVSALNKVFDWATISKRGLLLFVDEADTFLRKRNSGLMSTNVADSLRVFLDRTGNKSNRLMLVLASNCPQLIDTAIINRIDEAVSFKLPGLAERERMIRLYFDEFVLIPATEGKRNLKVESFDYDKVCTDIAMMIEGFSGREIVKLASAWQFIAYAADDGLLTKDMVMAEVHNALGHHEHKARWQSDEEAKTQILDSSVSTAVDYSKSSS